MLLFLIKIITATDGSSSIFLVSIQFLFFHSPYDRSVSRIPITTPPVRFAFCFTINCQIPTTAECPPANGLHAVRDCDTCQRSATREGVASNVFHIVAYYNVFNQVAPIKGFVLNRIHTTRYNDIFFIAFVFNQISFFNVKYVLIILSPYHRTMFLIPTITPPDRLSFCFTINCQIPTTTKCIVTDARHTVGDCHARKSGAITEGLRADARHAVGDCHARKSDTIIEGLRADARHAIGDSYARKSLTTREGTINRHRDFSFFLDSGAAFIVTPLL